MKRSYEPTTPDRTKISVANKSSKRMKSSGGEKKRTEGNYKLTTEDEVSPSIHGKKKTTIRESREKKSVAGLP